MIFNPTVNVGELLQIVVILGGIAAVAWQHLQKLTVLQVNHEQIAKRLDSLDAEFIELTKIASTIAVQDQRLKNLEQTVIDLSTCLKGHMKSSEEFRETIKESIKLNHKS